MLWTTNNALYYITSESTARVFDSSQFLSIFVPALVISLLLAIIVLGANKKKTNHA